MPTEKIQLQILANGKPAEKAITGVDKKVKKLGKTSITSGKQAQVMLSNMKAGWVAVGIAVAGAALKAKDALAIQVKAETALSSTIKMLNKNGAMSIEMWKEYASELQKLGTVGDEVILMQINMAKNMGRTDEQAKKLVETSINMSRALGIDVNTAVRTLGMSLAGNEGTLRRYIPIMPKFTSEQLKLGKAIEWATEQFKNQDKAFAQTDIGKYEQASNRLGDAWERLGGVSTPILTTAVDALVVAFSGLNTLLETSKNIWLDLTGQTKVVEKRLGLTQQQIQAESVLNAKLEEKSKIEKQINDNWDWLTSDKVIKSRKKQLSEVTKTIAQQKEYVSTLEAIRVAENKLKFSKKNKNSYAEVAKITDKYSESVEKLTVKITTQDKIIKAYKESLFELNTLKQAGTITTEQYTKGLNSLTTSHQKAIQSIADMALDKRIAEMSKNMEDSITNAITNMEFSLNGLKNLAKSVFRSIAAEMVRTTIAKPIASAASSYLGSALGSYLGGGVSFGNAASSITPGGFTMIPGKAKGGTVAGNKPYLVGEKGAELFVPSKTGTIVPNGAGIGGNVTNITVNYSPQVASLDPKTASIVIAENAPTVVGIVRQAFNRTGQSVPI